MRSPRLALFLMFAAFALALPAARAHADTYSLVTLHSDEGYFFYAMDDSGHVVLDNGLGNPGATSCAVNTCFLSYLNGASSGTSFTAPSITADSGASCTPSLPAGWSSFFAVCNNGRTAFTGEYQGNPPTGVYFTTSPTPPLGGPQIGDGPMFMDALGDVVFDDAFGDNWYEAIDTSVATTPEPSSLLLLATGALTLAAFAFTRRRSSIA